MDYSVMANTVRKNVGNLVTASSNINTSTLDSIWSGNAHDTLTSNLNTSLTGIKEQGDLAKEFADALEKLNTYKINKDTISSLVNRYYSLPNTTEYKEEKSSISEETNGLKKINADLRKSIQTTLNKIKAVSSQFEPVSYSASENEAYKGYIIDLGELISLFKTGNLTSISSNGTISSLYDYYSEDEVSARLELIRSQYSGRDATVNCALGVVEMAASFGKTLNIDWGADDLGAGTYADTFAMWAVNQGSSTQISSVSLVNAGVFTEFENARKGDILVYDVGGDDRVLMIVDNNPDTQEFTLLEASDSSEGVVITTKSYASLTGAYEARDLSSIYND